MQLNRKGPTTGFPPWLLATLLISLMGKVGLQQVQSSEGVMQLVAWHNLSELQAIDKQSKPALLFFPGVGSAKSDEFERTVFTNPLVAQAIVQNYYPVRVRENSPSEFKALKQLHLRYYLAQVPAILIVSPKLGTNMGMQVGAKSAAQTYDFLESLPRSESFSKVLERESKPHAQKPEDASEKSDPAKE